MPEQKKQQKMPQEIFIRTYPKVIFFYPLLITSFILFLIQLFLLPNVVLGYIWFIVFFTNIFVIAFDFSSTKFFVLILAIVIVVLVLVFLVLPYYNLSIVGIQIDVALPWEFYMLMTLILAFILGIVLISTRFEYYKIEMNEIIHKAGIFSSADRYPVKSLRFKKEIPDVFEFFMLRAGRLTIMPGQADEVMILPTVLNINKKEQQLDYLLSHVSVEPDELDDK
ncbi:MAG: hypothetical protein ACFFDF_16995 [Candidatus Odinarchaeota archaeon]